MLRLLSERESGILSPLILRRAETARRNFSLELSKYKDVEVSHKGGVNSLDIDVAENRYLLSGCSDSTIAIHDVLSKTGEVKETFSQVCSVSHNRGSQKHSVETVQWYPMDTGMFTTSGADFQLKVWDTNRLKLADKYTFSGLVYSHHMSLIARKHCLIAVGAGRSTVKLVDIKSGSASHQLKGHDAPVYSVRWSSKDEFLLATGGTDRKVILWDIRKAKGHLMALDQHNGEQATNTKDAKVAHDGTVNSIHFTPDGLHLVTYGTDNQIRLWNTTTGKNIMVNYGMVTNTVKKAVQSSIYSASSPQVLFVPSDSNIQVFDLFKGIHLATLSGHYNIVNCCVSHLDSQYLFSGGSDRNILVWVPSTETEDYEDHLRTDSKDCVVEGRGVKRTIATADAWSSDDET
ncbi:DNA excision repair protein ERCC-8-like [Littorina saxatilis]|uniref:DNA excision repair protein ERCC-8 n=1 Tax=Littorina saxatilis TaxID=31220 RepID=A0AAN9B8H3_9CAEN